MSLLDPLKKSIETAEGAGVPLDPIVKTMAHELVLQAMAESLAPDAGQRMARWGWLRKRLASAWWRYNGFLKRFWPKLARYKFYPLSLVWLHSRLVWARGENLKLRHELKALANEVVDKMHLAPGDLLVFKVSNAGMGHAFGSGWACLRNVQDALSRAAGGAVGVMASQKLDIDIMQLNKQAREFLRNQLDACDRGEKVPAYKLVPGFTKYGPIPR